MMPLPPRLMLLDTMMLMPPPLPRRYAAPPLRRLRFIYYARLLAAYAIRAPLMLDF